MMLLRDWSLYGSKLVKFLLDCNTISPPYCGFPMESHQFPVPAVVAFVVTPVVEVVLVTDGAVVDTVVVALLVEVAV